MTQTNSVNTAMQLTALVERTILFFLFLLPALINATSPHRKIFVDLQTIEHIDPLRHGFDIFIPKSLKDTQLQATKIPCIYVSAIPLAPGLKDYRNILFDLAGLRIHVEDLAEREWYYVCLEFENTNHENMRGNFSTSCRLVRTLDKFGKSAKSFLSAPVLHQVHNSGFSFTTQVDVKFPVELSFYLEADGQVMSFMVDRPRTLQITFDHMVPGFNYGKLCVLETPVESRYSSMGRTINENLDSCHLNDLTTRPKAAAVTGSKQLMFDKAGAMPCRDSNIAVLGTFLMVLFWHH